MEGYRIEHDSLGEVKVPESALWGAQTQRSLQNFTIGGAGERMPLEVITALAYIKKAAALANHELLPERMTKEKLAAIAGVCDSVTSGELSEHFPLAVFQTGSGTQTNMNVNEVIANKANFDHEKKLLHPNDDVNMSQSSNDTFPSAMHVAALLMLKRRLIPAAEGLINTFLRLEKENEGLVKAGRTHLQDAVPIAFSQEISGWRSSVSKDVELIKCAIEPLREIALGGTAVGTGLNAPEGFGEKAAQRLSEMTGERFISAKNKFHALTSKDELVFAHGAVKALACDMLKIANDIRFLASGPRLGYGEITIPANEPGSSIMPGKVNPTQCEQVTMVAVQVMGNDAAISTAAAGGNFELNVFMPVIIHNFLRSARLLADSIESFDKNCVRGIKANGEKMKEYLYSSLMTATALNPVIGYENTAKVVKKAYEENITLRDACVSLGLLSGERFDELYHPEKMI